MESNQANLRSRFESYIIDRNKVDDNDSHSIYKLWINLIELLSANEAETIQLIESSTKEEIDIISEVMEEVSERLNSKAYIEALKSASMKFPECKLDEIIIIAIKHMKNQY